MHFYIILEKRQGKKMLKYEIKKVFAKTSCRIAVWLMAALLAVICWFACGVSYVNSEGISESGYQAVRKLRLERKAWAGYLDEETLQLVIEKNAEIAASPEANSKEVNQNNIAYARKQGFRDIRDLLNYSYSDGFREYNYYKADSLTSEDAGAFYKNRIRLLAEWLEEDGKEQFGEKEKEYLIRQYEELETPMYYDYSEGWRQLFEYSPSVIMIFVLILGFLVAGIFGNEFTWKADSVFYSSKHGRDRAVRAKLRAGLWITTVFYWAVMLIYTGIVLALLGADGANCPIQAHFSGWKSFYNITVWQEYLLIAAGGYIGSLFFALLTMLISARTRSTVLAVIVPFVLVFLPSFLSNIQSAWVNKVLGLLPDRLLQISAQLKYFDVYAVGNTVMGAVPLLLILYGVVSVLLYPIIYRVYAKIQVS